MDPNEFGLMQARPPANPRVQPCMMSHGLSHAQDMLNPSTTHRYFKNYACVISFFALVTNTTCLQMEERGEVM